MLTHVSSISLYSCVSYESSLVFFFFKQKTAYEMRISDWSSDVCSSDLTRISVIPPENLWQCNGHDGKAHHQDDHARNFGREQTSKAPHQQIGRASCRERVCQYV